MCLLDTVSVWDSEGIECTATSHRGRDNPLRHGGELPVVAGIEYAAQAIALHGALNTPTAIPRRGYLATLSELRWSVESLHDTGPELRVRARRLSVSGAGASYAFCLHVEDRELLAGTVVIALEPAG